MVFLAWPLNPLAAKIFPPAWWRAPRGPCPRAPNRRGFAPTLSAREREPDDDAEVMTSWREIDVLTRVELLPRWSPRGASLSAYGTRDTCANRHHLTLTCEVAFKSTELRFGCIRSRRIHRRVRPMARLWEHRGSVRPERFPGSPLKSRSSSALSLFLRRKPSPRLREYHGCVPLPSTDRPAALLWRRARASPRAGVIDGPPYFPPHTVLTSLPRHTPSTSGISRDSPQAPRHRWQEALAQEAQVRAPSTSHRTSRARLLPADDRRTCFRVSAISRNAGPGFTPGVRAGDRRDATRAMF